VDWILEMPVMGDTILRKVSSKAEREVLIGDYLIDGYEVLDLGIHSALLRKRTWGTAKHHFLLGVISAWWTFGMGNLAYAMVARSRADKVLLRYQAGCTRLRAFEKVALAPEELQCVSVGFKTQRRNLS